MASMDYYLIHHLGISHLTWLAFDAINITLLIICIQQARSAIQASEGEKAPSNIIRIASGSMGWVTWLFMSIAVAAKSVVIFHYFSDDLDESSTFFGPNTLKTTIALGSCTFLLLLITQHNAPAGSDGRRYIEELTGTVVFDILDTVDILEVLFDSDERDALWSGLEGFILAVAVLNLILPTVPLFTLAKSKFGQRKLSIKLIHGHRILLVLAVNMPNLLVRLLLWHGMSSGISPFTLKNILAISLTFYDIYEHNKEELEDINSGEGKGRSDEDPVKLEKKLTRGPGSDFQDPRSFHKNGSPLPTDSGVESPTPHDFYTPKDNQRERNGGKRNRGNRPYTNHDYHGDLGRGKNYQKSETMSSGGSETADEHDSYSQKPPLHINTTSV
ncbi:cat eye syndrome critical region protein 6-like protein [Elysia marginata]|uniref:Cat eye syndrome critical region protein 6-like protein n=1 Tax=Elysia marginata TaxID=1093978 RepID=A0AAV4EH06_9GAST|nr:cat eye syndrome critical region protein 6-like protein [Elysia marginata]